MLRSARPLSGYASLALLSAERPVKPPRPLGRYRAALAAYPAVHCPAFRAATRPKPAVHRLVFKTAIYPEPCTALTGWFPHSLGHAPWPLPPCLSAPAPPCRAEGLPLCFMALSYHAHRGHFSPCRGNRQNFLPGGRSFPQQQALLALYKKSAVRRPCVTGLAGLDWIGVRVQLISIDCN